jgi:hypothetical protein
MDEPCDLSLLRDWLLQAFQSFICYAPCVCLIWGIGAHVISRVHDTLRRE